MKIIQKKCPSCNGNLEIEDNIKDGTCPYCGTGYIFDDDTIEVKYTGSVEIKDDYDYEIAFTTLDKFKDYDKSAFMFKNLINRYGHKKEVYIGYVRALTHDFTLKEYTNDLLNEVNSNFNKYQKLAKDKEVKEYIDKVKKINSLYWINKIKVLTDNFSKMKNVNIKVVKDAWDNYKKYTDDNSINKYKDKFNDYYVSYLDKAKLRKKKHFVLTSVIILLFIVIVGFFVLISLFEKPKFKNDMVMYSVINMYEKDNNEEDFLNRLFSNPGNLNLTGYSLDEVDKTLYLGIQLQNFIKTVNYEFKLDIKDDLGPVFVNNECYFTDTEDINLYECVMAKDFSDGDIKKDNIIINKESCDFTRPGTCTINVKAVDSDSIETELDIPVIIEPAKLTVGLNIKDKKLVEGDTTTLSVSIKPNVKDETYTLEYDNSIISIDKNNKIKALKKGVTQVCVIPNYDKSAKVCDQVNVSLKCKSSYTFKFEGGSVEGIKAGEDFCPGTYRFTTKVLDREKSYYLYYKPNGSYIGESYLVWKNYSYHSEEGKKIVFADESVFEIPIGVTEVKLYK